MYTMQLMPCKIAGFCELHMAAFTFALQGHCALSLEVTERKLKFFIGNEKVSIAFTSGFIYLTPNFWWKGQQLMLHQSNLHIHCLWVDVGGDLQVVDWCWHPVHDFWFFNWWRLWFHSDIVWSWRTICCVFCFHKWMSQQLIVIVSNFFGNRNLGLQRSGDKPINSVQAKTTLILHF